MGLRTFLVLSYSLDVIEMVIGVSIEVLGCAWIKRYNRKPIVRLEWWERYDTFKKLMFSALIGYSTELYFFTCSFVSYFGCFISCLESQIINDRARHVTYETVIPNSEVISQKEEMSLLEKQLNIKMNFQLVKHWLPSSSLLLLEVVLCNFYRFSNQLLLRFNSKWWNT